MPFSFCPYHYQQWFLHYQQWFCYALWLTWCDGLNLWCWFFILSHFYMPQCQVGLCVLNLLSFKNALFGMWLWNLPFYLLFILLTSYNHQAGVDHRSEESRCIQCTKCGNSHLWICTNRTKAKARWCQVRVICISLILHYVVTYSLLFKHILSHVVMEKL